MALKVFDVLKCLAIVVLQELLAVLRRPNLLQSQHKHDESLNPATVPSYLRPKAIQSHLLAYASHRRLLRSCFYCCCCLSMYT